MKDKNKMIKNDDVKMNPAIARQQAEIDKQTENPIDVSNAPDDADHDSNFKE